MTITMSWVHVVGFVSYTQDVKWFGGFQPDCTDLVKININISYIHYIDQCQPPTQARGEAPQHV